MLAILLPNRKFKVGSAIDFFKKKNNISEEKKHIYSIINFLTLKETMYQSYVELLLQIIWHLNKNEA